MKPPSPFSLVHHICQLAAAAGERRRQWQTWREARENIMVRSCTRIAMTSNQDHGENYHKMERKIAIKILGKSRGNSRKIMRKSLSVLIDVRSFVKVRVYWCTDNNDGAMTTTMTRWWQRWPWAAYEGPRGEICFIIRVVSRARHWTTMRCTRSPNSAGPSPEVSLLRCRYTYDHRLWSKKSRSGVANLGFYHNLAN